MGTLIEIRGNARPPEPGEPPQCHSAKATTLGRQGRMPCVVTICLPRTDAKRARPQFASFLPTFYGTFRCS